MAAFVRALQPETVLETGSAFGQTAEAIGRALAANGHGRLVTIEPDTHRAQATVDRCVGLPVLVRVCSSLDYVPEDALDFAWFDSLLELRPREFRRYLPFLSSRAVVGFHDTGPQHPVRQSLDPLVASGVLPPPLYLPTPRGVCFARILGPGTACADCA